VANAHVRGEVDDDDGLRELVGGSRVTTYDLEATDAPALERLSRRGHDIQPEPNVLATIQDKLTQRTFFAVRGFPVPRFFGADEPTVADARRLGFPVVQKSRRGGYDGRGVVIMRDESDVGRMLHVPSLFEECVPIEAEISVVVARSRNGETRCYPAVEMMFDPELNLIDGLLFPARVDEITAERARDLASHAVDTLGGVGVFAVELFLGPAGALWLNEIAPRPHNSGHVTIEAAVTCQFEQHVRAVTGMPLGDTSLIRPAAMVNLTGPASAEGPPDLPGLSSALAVPGARLHLYGKTRVRPGRKMGHITVLDENPLAALERARQARRLLGLRARRAA
jgi:5-(carboxyamino)imidazole ribonucleotide synthase